jgi:hypothetical protein
MDHELKSSQTTTGEPLSLKKALEKNTYVEETIEDCATELSRVNKTIKKELATIPASQQAKTALAQNEAVEDRMH